MSFKHDPAYRGIFVQRNVEYKDSRKRARKPFCVTFPRLGNLDKDLESQTLLPSHDFPTFKAAHEFALAFKNCDPRLRDSPVFFLDQRWVGSSTKREFQRIG